MDYEIHLLFKAHNAIQKQKYKKNFYPTIDHKSLKVPKYQDTPPIPSPMKRRLSTKRLCTPHHNPPNHTKRAAPICSQKHLEQSESTT